MQATSEDFSTKLRPRGVSRRDRYKEKKRKNIWTYFLKMLQVLAILNDVTSALGYLHNRRIIHRYLIVRNIALVSHTFWHSFSNCISFGEFFLVDLQGSEAWKCCLETRREQTCVQADRPRICQRTRSKWNAWSSIHPWTLIIKICPGEQHGPVLCRDSPVCCSRAFPRWESRNSFFESTNPQNLIWSHSSCKYFHLSAYCAQPSSPCVLFCKLGSAIEHKFMKVKILLNNINRSAANASNKSQTSFQMECYATYVSLNPKQLYFRRRDQTSSRMVSHQFSPSTFLLVPADAPRANWYIVAHDETQLRI